MMYVSRMNFKCDGFAFGRVGHILVSILPILMSFVAISSVFHQSRPCWLSQFYLNRASLEIEQEEECLTCQMKTEKQTEFPRFTEENQTNHTRDRKLRNRTNKTTTMTMIFTKAGLSISKEPRIAAAFVRSICVVTKGIDITCVTVGQ